MSVLEVRGLGVDYDGVRVLERIDLSVAAGAFCTVVGASGCGKSTFLRILLGQERPTRGEVLLDGVPIPPEPMPDRGVVFQKYSVFAHLSVRDNLALPLEIQRARGLGRLFGRARRQVRAEVADLLHRIGLEHAGDRYPGQLSGGMQQRLAIGQALVLKPRVLLLDEPFGALDPGIKKDMHALILNLWQDTGMTVFMVTHDIQEAFQLGTRLVVFDKLRHDPHAPRAFGATITYDLPLRPPQPPAADRPAGPDPAAAAASQPPAPDAAPETGETPDAAP
ncbi:lauroyl acyltransferase [Rhodovibrio sodomensis]|uniref:Lauroyl acyltransferase n=1 Tax=Rhodovibrio sodomensis TaxID=1088 RepID=A0ABS1DBB3_9PROT|nr:lauroyl acyltransferase [Rhodovibrio sodomensis]